LGDIVQRIKIGLGADRLVIIDKEVVVDNLNIKFV
jgi:hypothetical protein